SYESILKPTKSSRREEDLVILGGLRVIFRWAGGWDDLFGWWRRKGGKAERRRLFFWFKSGRKWEGFTVSLKKNGVVRETVVEFLRWWPKTRGKRERGVPVWCCSGEGEDGGFRPGF
ncbi:hypothetical protein HAX54_006586, partial [Datura stramonium]|nr:hypothetical protein [Datura stramonium]